VRSCPRRRRDRWPEKESCHGSGRRQQEQQGGAEAPQGLRAMPLSRHTVGNEYALGGRDLYRTADQHDPEAVLDGVAMAGLVGVLRQLGDLAE